MDSQADARLSGPGAVSSVETNPGDSLDLRVSPTSTVVPDNIGAESTPGTVDRLNEQGRSPKKRRIPSPIRITLKSSPSGRKSPLRSATSPEKLVENLTEDAGVVFGNFHAFETDEQESLDEAATPNLVNGCRRVIPDATKMNPDDSCHKIEAQVNNNNNNHSSNFNGNTYVSSSNNKSRLVPYDKDTRCGMQGCGSCCQRLANPKLFLVVFCTVSVLQGMFYTYFASVLSTIQKVYGISSSVTGLIMSATEVGQIGGSLFVSFYGNAGHRPRWMGIATIVFALCSSLCIVPHILFYLYYGSSVFNHINFVDRNSEKYNLCSISVSQAAEEQCQISNVLTSVILALFFVSLIGVGIGQTALANLGIPYIDDNIDNKDSPMYIATAISLKILGPTLGYLLGSVCTRIYVWPLQNPGYDTSDSRWIGAWWLGLVIVAVPLFAAGVAMLQFPRRFPTKKTFTASNTINSINTNTTTIESPPCSPEDGKVRTNISALQEPHSIISSVASSVDEEEERQCASGSDEESMQALKPMLNEGREGCGQEPHECCPSQRERPKLEDFPKVLKRQLRNKTLLLRTASTVFRMLPIAGLYTFLPKYLETQFRLEVHTAAILSGVGGILLMMVGMMSSGVFICIRRPSARSVAAWSAIAALVYAFGMIALMFLGCEQDDYVGLTRPQQGSVPVFMAPCNRTCTCDDSVFSPVCTPDGHTHFSACHLGCTNVSSKKHNDAEMLFGCGCESAEESDGSSYGPLEVKLGSCELQCNNLKWYILVLAISVTIYSSSDLGGILITLRCGDPTDKAMALGIVGLAVASLSNVPCPIIYGGIVDATCIHWRTICGEKGDCQLYDAKLFRLLFHGTTALFMLVAFLFDIGVCFSVKDLSIYDEDDKDDDAPELAELSPLPSSENPELSHNTLENIIPSASVKAPNSSVKGNNSSSKDPQNGKSVSGKTETSVQGNNRTGTDVPEVRKAFPSANDEKSLDSRTNSDREEHQQPQHYNSANRTYRSTAL